MTSHATISSSETGAGGSPRPAFGRKQAVVLVHGMGEQFPMETLRGFVETMWVRDPSLHASRASDNPGEGNPIWWKPDLRTGSLELSRVTTRSIDDPKGPRTDFYELYWADLTEANTLDQLKDWYGALLIRWPSQVPRDVFVAWLLLWSSTLLVAVLLGWQALDKIGWLPAPAWALRAAVAIGIAYAAGIKSALNTFGDVARYVRAQPANIAARREIRQRGLALLAEIEKSRYERVILVGHSLGSIIAYDLLRFLWSSRTKMRTMTKGKGLDYALTACVQAAASLESDETPQSLGRYRAAQKAVFDALTPSDDEPWLISDFVTIGSPIAHAQFLLERDQAAFDRAKHERRLPTSPSVLEEGGLVYEPRPSDDPTLLQAHHASVFAAVRWTNVYDPCRGILFGDFIGGPVRSNFGKGILDMQVTIEDAFSILPERFFTHTKYWSDVSAKNPHLPILRNALALRP